MTKASGCEVELSKERLHQQEAFMSHANAALTPLARLRLARLIVDDRWTPSTAAKMFMVSPRTARKWAERYRAEGGPARSTGPAGRIPARTRLPRGLLH